jgi:hypothetical protein
MRSGMRREYPGVHYQVLAGKFNPPGENLKRIALMLYFIGLCSQLILKFG